ncbi:Sister chromatid cohesion protein PDS5 homolog C [Linum grandiflorum]
MADAETDLLQQLQDVGVLLKNPSSSLDNLLPLLDRVEKLLMRVEQTPSGCMKDAVISIMKGLISTVLVRHSNPDVRISLAYCYTQFTRITAPDTPYDDYGMKHLFQLTVEAFQYLSHSTSQYNSKAVSILNTAAEIRSCLVMLDMGVDQLILDMFGHFLAIDGSNCSPDTILAMETIMSLVIDQSDAVSVAMLTPLLASVRKDNQTISPIAWKLGEKVISNCAAKLKTPLNEAVHSLGIALDQYASIVADICYGRALIQQSQRINLGTEKPTVPRKRGRPKRKALVNIEQLYDHPRVQTETCRRVGRPRKNGTKDSDPISASTIKDEVFSSQVKDSDDPKRIIGKRVRVWWPVDKAFYEGAVDSYDPTSKKHKILYADGDEEILNLKKEIWELLEDHE